MGGTLMRQISVPPCNAYPYNLEIIICNSGGEGTKRMEENLISKHMLLMLFLIKEIK